MNRKLMFGIATFFAIVGLALTGGENQVQAGFGCGGGGLFAKHHSCGGGGKLGGLFSGHRRNKSECSGTPVPPPAPPVCEPAAPPSCDGGGEKCHGGLFARLKAKCAARKAAKCGGAEPAPCCDPAPAPAAPCCDPAPAPAPCCDAAPMQVMEAAPCCGAAAAPAAAPVYMEAPVMGPVGGAPCCAPAMDMGAPMMEPTPAPMGGVMYEGAVGGSYDGASAGGMMVNDRGEEIVPGSVQIIDDGSGAAAGGVPEPAPVAEAVEAAVDGI